MHDRPARVPPYAAFFATLLLLGPVHLLLPIVHVFRFPWSMFGVIGLVLAVPVASGQQSAFGRHRQGGMYTDVPTRLITDGPFRYTRNPLYLAMALATLGIAVMLGSLGALLLIAAEVAVMTVGIRYEERVLHREFGEEYDAYRRRVRRWI